MRVAVLGAGAMGSIFGAALARSGAEVVFFDKRTEVVEAINRDGLRLSGVLGDFTLKNPATSDPKALGKVDVALVLVDANATAEVAKVAEECLKPDGFALTLQNGIGNYEVLAERLGRGARARRLDVQQRRGQGARRRGSHQSRADVDRRA